MQRRSFRFALSDDRVPAAHALEFAILRQRVRASLGPQTDEQVHALLDAYNAVATSPLASELENARLGDPTYQVGRSDDGNPYYALPNDVECLRSIAETRNLEEFSIGAGASWSAVFAALGLSLLQEATSFDDQAKADDWAGQLAAARRDEYLFDYLRLTGEAISAADAFRAAEQRAAKSRQQTARAGGLKRNARYAQLIDRFVEFYESTPQKSVRNAATRFLELKEVQAYITEKKLGGDDPRRLLTDGYRRRKNEREAARETP